MILSQICEINLLKSRESVQEICEILVNFEIVGVDREKGVRISVISNALTLLCRCCQIIAAECIDIIIMDIPRAVLIPSKCKETEKTITNKFYDERITMNDKTYYTNDKKQGNLFEISKNYSIGIPVGYLVNSVPYLF